MAKHKKSTVHATHVKSTIKHKHIVLKPHHSKPFRKRQLLLLGLSLAVLTAAILKLGTNIGNQQASTVPIVQTIPTSTSSVTVVRSSYGFSLALDGNVFAVSGTQLTDGGDAVTVAQNDLHQGAALTSVTVRPRTGTVPRGQAASQVSIVVNPNAAAFAAAQARAADGATPGEVAASLFTQSSTNEYDVSVLSAKADTLNGVPVRKTIYQYTPKFSGGNSYAIVWTGVTGGRAFAVKLQGLVGSSNIPAVFTTVFDSLTIASDQGVKGAFTNIFAPKVSADASKLDTKYLSDALSPAVVKLYHLICGTLSINGQPINKNTCVGFSGSGFLATTDGYIATNGHVVQYSAKDELVDILTSDPAKLASFLKGLGLSDAQIVAVSQDPATLASIIAKIYDVSDSVLNFADANEAVLVALGTKVPKFTSLNSSSDLDSFKKDSADFKVAKVVGVNYSSKDALMAVADPKQGFSSSDVAIVKISISNAPTIPISKSQVTQNEKIVVMGFPGDADNSLTDNSKLSVSVTDGVVSSIRDAAGGNGKLYQSDADASHGNSGGPAIDESGSVIGLLTYRESGDSSGNAAKSYIRDIADITTLAKKNNVELNSTSTTQTAWQEGLSLYSLSHFSAAIKKFDVVATAYPEHRLVQSYISSARTAIADGKDVKSLPIALIIGAIAVAVVGAGIGITMIIRHRVHHHLYNAYQPAMPGGVPSPNGFVVPQPAPTVASPAMPVPAPVVPQVVNVAAQSPAIPTQKPITVTTETPANPPTNQ